LAVVTPLSRDRLLIVGCIASVFLLAWVYLFLLARQMSSSMADGVMMAEMGMATAWTAADLLLAFAMWTVMMVGMMSGSAAPVLLLFARVRSSRNLGGVKLGVLLFALGYLAVWTGFSAIATTAQWLLQGARMLSPAMAASSPVFGGMILVLAGAYQLTSFKNACLSHCRTPLGFLVTNWRDGYAGAFQMGLRHGIDCLGCCWALMCVLFVVGVMNLLWVAALTVFIFIEKIGPGGRLVAQVSGAAMVVAGVLLASRLI